MLFPTLDFGLFFLAAFAGAWGLRRQPTARLLFLIAASYVFYSWWDWRFTLLLFGSSSWNWWAGRAIHASGDARRRRQILTLAIAVDLGVLAVFKYMNFFIGSANVALEALGASDGLPYLRIVLPVGISFFTFHGISYVVDLHRGHLKQPAGFLPMLLYISFFPQLVAGPIVRAAHFLPQLTRPVDPDDIRATRAYLLIIGGLFKKVVVANYLATDLVDPAFFDPSSYGAVDLALAVYGYAIQIYCDFSAYTDIAIGVAALLGYRFPQNFDQPYRAASLQEFWRRWHISLSSWLRDYLYIPLGGNAGGPWRRTRNLMLTMLLGGLWHGAAWTFVLWGGLHGAGLAVERLVREQVGLQLPRLAGVLATFHVVCLAWIFFRAPDLDHAWSILGGLGRIGTAPVLASPFILVLVAAGLAMQALPANWIERLERWCTPLPLAAQGAMLAMAIVAIDRFGPSGVAPFIYFQF